MNDILGVQARGLNKRGLKRAQKYEKNWNLATFAKKCWSQHHAHSTLRESATPHGRIVCSWFEATVGSEEIPLQLLRPIVTIATIAVRAVWN